MIKQTVRRQKANNYLAEHFYARGHKKVAPTPEVLTYLHMSMWAFMRIWDKKKDPEISQSLKLCEWLCIDLSELFKEPTFNRTFPEISNPEQKLKK